jgi:peptidoglycan/LPS O-acetylase OafA/YrhL
MPTNARAQAPLQPTQTTRSPTRPAAASLSTPPPAHIRGLDGLRAIAVLAVVFYHLSPGFVPGGYIGVDVFFVISGFLITGLLLRERDTTGRIRLAAFWARRARRLVPALVTLLLVCGAAAWLIGGDVLVHLGRQLIGALSFSSNWVAIGSGQSYFDTTTPDLFRNLWSLAIEEQFYLIWPIAVLLLALVRSVRIRFAIVTAIAIASAVEMAFLVVPGGDATRVYYGTDTHSFGLALGAALGIATSRWAVARMPNRRWFRVLMPITGLVALALVIVIAFVMPADSLFPYRGGLAIVAVLTVVAIAGSVTAGSVLGRALDLRPLRWVGARSYGLYLWHWPVFVLVLAALPAAERTGASGWLLGGIALVITVVAAALSYRFLERPIRRDGFRTTVRRWFARRHAVATVIGSLLIVAMATATVGGVIRDPGQSGAQAEIERGARAVSSPPPTAEPTPSSPTEKPVPTGGQLSAIGDSVMLASAPELQAAFPGISIDAVVSRQASAAPALVQSMIANGTLRQTLIMGLGTNGPVDPSALEAVHAMLGRSRNLVVINVQAPRGWVDGVNTELTAFASRYRNVEMDDWKDAIAPQLGLLSSDQIHPGPHGGQIYAQTLADALQRLANRPPLPPSKPTRLAIVRM